MKNRVFALMMAAGLLASVSSALAQPKEPAKPAAPQGDAKAPVAPSKAPEPAAAPKFGDDEMSAVAAAMTGSWIATGIPNAGGNGTADVALNVAPVVTRDMGTLLYAEVARADALNRPHRQALWQFHRAKGKLHLKTMEFRRPRGELMSAAGLWAAPEVFPAIGSEDVVTTLDIELTKGKDGKTWTGKTLYPYPTSMGGAVTMTSEMSVSPDTFTASDKGFDGDDKVVWGPDKDHAGGFTFHRTDSGVKVQRLDGGLVVLDFPAKADGNAAKPGEKVLTNYTMYLANGWMADSSFERGSPLPYIVGSRFVPGWTTAMNDAKKGMQRKYVIPGPLAFGPSGELRGKVPANATLYIDVQIVDVVPNVLGAGAQPLQLQPVNANDMKRVMEDGQKATSDKPPVK